MRALRRPSGPWASRGAPEHAKRGDCLTARRPVNGASMDVLETEVILRDAGNELARVTLPPGEYVIGRSAEAHIRADTPLISRRHALLTITDKGATIQDLGSSNGTFVADKPIADRTLLFADQSIRLGDVVLELRR